ncbi:DUF4349 domain-containing protein [Fulvivirga aurantia]|uniref:DUF4349 domain-containing protein n=1 Tax=Fulvivirga aurantia TaxID=2529383 RepID=UPI001624EAFD|nr:DUF4349 domain-containing protein [Fulvivirga aurantia]
MRTLLLIITTFIVSSCTESRLTNDNYAEIAYLEAMDIMEFTAVKHPPTPQESTIQQKLIKSGRIQFETDDVAHDYQIIQSFLGPYQAYIENENENRSTQQINYNLVLRVPAPEYDSLFAKITAIAKKIDHKATNVEDVTERYYDLSTRIKNKQQLENRYLKLLDKATEVKDMLEIERNLNDVRIEIESLQGQFKYLSKQINYSTIAVDFYETLPYTYHSSPREGFLARLLTAITNGWQKLLSFTVVAISFWPFLILTGLAILAFKHFKKLKISRSK